MSNNSGITGSGAGRVRPNGGCPASLALPQVKGTNKAAERGTEIHEYLCKLAKDPSRKEEWLAAVSEEYRHTCIGINLAGAMDGIDVRGLEMAYVLEWAGILLMGLARNGAGFDIALGAEVH